MGTGWSDGHIIARELIQKSLRPVPGRQTPVVTLALAPFEAQPDGELRHARQQGLVLGGRGSTGPAQCT